MLILDLINKIKQFLRNLFFKKTVVKKKKEKVDEKKEEETKIEKKTINLKLEDEAKTSSRKGYGNLYTKANYDELKELDKKINDLRNKIIEMDIDPELKEKELKNIDKIENAIFENELTKNEVEIIEEKVEETIEDPKLEEESDKKVNDLKEDVEEFLNYLSF